MNFTLSGNPLAKLGKHSGMFTRSYQEVRAKYDAQIRNWEISFRDNLFFICSADGAQEVVYYEPLAAIENCSCDGFAELGSGTCMHIEALKLIPIQTIPRVRVRPITFVNSNGLVQTIGEPNKWETPAVRPVSLLEIGRRLQYNDTVYSDVDVFEDYGINLYSFQVEAVRAMLRGVRSTLILRMGLGKTLCALACIKLLGDQNKKILIVAPNSLKYQWQGEINRFNLGSSLVVSSNVDLAFYCDQRFLILSYEMLNRHRWLLEREFDVLIADEIQKIKNRESEAWKTVSLIRSKYVFALSGTPIQNNINDLVSLINFLNPSEFKPEWKFYEEFCETTRAKILGLQEDKLDRFKKRVDRYMINPRVDYSKHVLPVKKEHITRTKLDERAMELHDLYMDQAEILIARSMNGELSFSERLALNGLLTKARMAATDARLLDKPEELDLPVSPKSEKFKRVEWLLGQLVSQGRKVVVYSEWIKSSDLLIPWLEENQIKYVRFNGSVSARKRDTVLQSFLNDPQVMVFLSTDSGGMGLDGLQLASADVIHLERMWNPMKLEQRNGRLVRTLQKAKEVNVYYFHTDAGVEEMIGANNGRKYDLVRSMFEKE